MTLGNNDWMMTLHWTGGGHVCGGKDREHYNFIIEADGTVMWNDKAWKSLSEVARTITGTRWSGPAFFGLRKKTGAAA